MGAEKNYLTLMKAAEKAVKNSYSPYSKFAVGAAVLGASGKIYTGVNVENVSYGLSICAERAAVFNAVSSGEKQIKAVAIFAKGTGAKGAGGVSPCGACRQVIAEFAPNAEIITNTKNGGITVNDLETLLPKPFKKK